VVANPSHNHKHRLSRALAKEGFFFLLVSNDMGRTCLAIRFSRRTSLPCLDLFLNSFEIFATAFVVQLGLRGLVDSCDLLLDERSADGTLDRVNRKTPVN